jgi:hypothetical protein
MTDYTTFIAMLESINYDYRFVDYDGKKSVKVHNSSADSTIFVFDRSEKLEGIE